MRHNPGITAKQLAGLVEKTRRQWYIEEVADFYDRTIEESVDQQAKGTMSMSMLLTLINRTRSEMYKIFNFQHEQAKKKGYTVTVLETRTYLERNLKSLQLQQAATERRGGAHVIDVDEMNLILTSASQKAKRREMERMLKEIPYHHQTPRGRGLLPTFTS